MVLRNLSETRIIDAILGNPVHGLRKWVAAEGEAEKVLVLKPETGNQNRDASHACVRLRSRGQDALGTAGETPALQNPELQAQLG